MSAVFSKYSSIGPLNGFSEFFLLDICFILPAFEGTSIWNWTASSLLVLWSMFLLSHMVGRWHSTISFSHSLHMEIHCSPYSAKHWGLCRAIHGCVEIWKYLDHCFEIIINYERSINIVALFMCIFASWRYVCVNIESYKRLTGLTGQDKIIKYNSCTGSRRKINTDHSLQLHSCLNTKLWRDFIQWMHAFVHIYIYIYVW